MRRAAYLVLLALAGCDDGVETPSWLRVEITPSAPQVHNALVLIHGESSTPLPLCVSLGGGTTASFVLERAADGDVATPVSVEVAPYGDVSGSLDPGRDFACPPSLPPPLGPSRRLSIAFCAGEARRVHFQLGVGCPCGGSGVGGSGVGGGGGAGGGGEATCCDDGLVCGAGVASTGSICPPDSCCRPAISDACGLLEAP
jgi:hypothetical protein